MKIHFLNIMILLVATQGCNQGPPPGTPEALPVLARYLSKTPDLSSDVKYRARKAFGNWQTGKLESRPSLIKAEISDYNMPKLKLFISSVGNRFDSIDIYEVHNESKHQRFLREKVPIFKRQAVKTGWYSIPIEYRKGLEKNSVEAWCDVENKPLLKISRSEPNVIDVWITIYDSKNRFSETLDPYSERELGVEDGNRKTYSE